jgi:hypothetical protein
MQNDSMPENAVAAIRVSTTKQGVDGDSPEAQKEQIESFAKLHNINLKETFIFLESASKDQQPMQQAINYCKDPKNNIQLFIIKSIDRFTRGGGSPYDQLKMQLERYGVKLVDIYGIISQKKVNTLEHLGVSYDWSEYSPTKKVEYLEAERAKDELRDIMSRMIGAEVRYTRMGYWMREPPFGFMSEKIDTPNGKRTILVPHPVEGPLVQKLFELRASGLYDDKQIAEKLNKLGFKSRKFIRRDRHDRTKIIAEQGENPLQAKYVAEYARKPIYAAIICEKWTNNIPVRATFKGLVDIELYNKANKGKWALVEKGADVELVKKQPVARYLNRRGTKTAEFSYRKVITCPDCEKPLLGSASRGKVGKYYPAYHCNKRGHYFRVPKQEFESTVKEFVSNIQLTPEFIKDVTDAAIAEYDQREKEEQAYALNFDEQVASLEAKATNVVNKIKVLSSEIAIKAMEEELMKIGSKIREVKVAKEEAASKQPIDIRKIMGNVRYYMEHLDELLLQQGDPVSRAEFFGVLFDKAPTYNDIKYGIKNPTALTGINELFKLKNYTHSGLVTSRRIELRLPG